MKICTQISDSGFCGEINVTRLEGRGRRERGDGGWPMGTYGVVM